MKSGEEEGIPFETRTKTLNQEICGFPRKVNLCGHLEQEKPIFNINLHCRAALQPTQGNTLDSNDFFVTTLKLLHYSVLIVGNCREICKTENETEIENRKFCSWAEFLNGSAETPQK